MGVTVVTCVASVHRENRRNDQDTGPGGGVIGDPWYDMNTKKFQLSPGKALVARKGLGD